MTIEKVTEQLTGPDVWYGPDIQNDPSWILQLDGDDVAEIDAALAAVKAAGVTIPFSASAFPLPNVANKIDQIVDNISHGRGLTLVRGLPRDRYSDADCELIYWGIGCHIGTPVSQNRRGHLLGHVRDEGRDINDPDARPYQTAAEMDFHCDLLPIDVLGLFCARAAKSGGESYVVSALTVHNIIREERPDYLEALYRPVNFDWAGEEPAGTQPYYSMPLFSVHDGKVSSRITSRRFVQMVTRHGAELAADPLALDAIEFAQAVAQRPELRLSMTLQDGDMEFLNNHTMLHARSAYEDWGEPGRQRHMLRMWVALDDAIRRPLSPLLDERYSWVARGGIPQKEAA